ncbi:MAG TPA: general secretion pathway protein GspB [Rudaea sp.]|jgi:general secretion pathway protein B
MSLILEALKKSEARRQLGEAPGLGTPFTVARRRRSPLPIIVVLVLAGAAFGWYYMRSMPRHPAAGETTATQAHAADTAIAGRPNPQTIAAANPAPANRFNAPTATPRTVAPAEPARSPFTGPGAPGQAARNTDARAHDPRLANPQASAVNVGAGEGGLGRAQHVNPGATNAVAPPRAAAEAAHTHPQLRGSALTGTAQPTTSAIAETRGAAASTRVATANPRPIAVPPPLPAPAPTPPQPAPTSPAPAAVAPAAPDMPLYYELPFNVRKDLPTLIVSMHVFAALPAQRFVVIDGERKVEGETIKEGLTLREIRADGIVLEFRGQKFFYPRPGR